MWWQSQEKNIKKYSKKLDKGKARFIIIIKAAFQFYIRRANINDEAFIFLLLEMSSTKHIAHSFCILLVP